MRKIHLPATLMVLLIFTTISQLVAQKNSPTSTPATCPNLEGMLADSVLALNPALYPGWKEVPSSDFDNTKQWTRGNLVVQRSYDNYQLRLTLFEKLTTHTADRARVRLFKNKDGTWWSDGDFHNMITSLGVILDALPERRN